MSRLCLLAALVAIAGALSASSGAAHSAVTQPAVTPAQLSVIVLPRSAFGPGASKLPIDSSSGVTSNKAASDDSIDPGITTAYLAKIGRTTGYDLSFQSASALAAKSGVVELTSEVDLFESPSGASALLHRYPADLQGMAGKTVGNGVSLGKVTIFSPGKIGDGATGFEVDVRAGGLHLWETSVGVQLGSLLLTVGVARADDTSETATTSRLARVLAQRAADVLAGRIHPTPVALPAAATQKLGGLGRPRGGPDLSAMALQPTDLSPAAAVSKQGYVRNKDDVAEYDRELGAGSFHGTQILYSDSQVELLPSVNDGKSYFVGVHTVMSGPAGRRLVEQAALSSIKGTQKPTFAFHSVASVKAGDGAFTISAGVNDGGTHLQLVLGFVNVGPVVTSVTFATEPGAWTAADSAALLQLAAEHARSALH